ncbi:carbamoyl phosphate synthase small subunit [Bacillus sp. 03113]|uniref:carbamoyl phosphate synthase small subunit n=1 Tax=Bacillus sp. 03113 TaxID=2578211 RepID=UPI001144502F|nr:carbamoyl phosphate synthase small subunit [Bacillus sp. 03113]
MEGYLHLESGDLYKGKLLTQVPHTEISGEIVFFTGMTGYQEVLTDPSYKDQIIVFTYPLIGNYGINEHDFESKKPHVAGVIVYEAKQNAFHYQSQYSLVEYLQKWNIPLLSHIDTRAVVKKIRSKGSMPAVISNSADSTVSSLESLLDEKVSKVTTSSLETHGDGEWHIALMDYGKKDSILYALLKRNCKVTVVPYDTSFNDIKALNPDGILLSNGPGDPKDIEHILPTVKKLIMSYPTLGICLGHQLAALAMGGNTKKLSFGHRGANHPVMDINHSKVFMSSQNHSYVVDEESLEGTGLKTRFINLHDRSVEGLTHELYPVQTVQFHPEANPGPEEGDYIFEEFIEAVKANNGRVFAYA